MFSLNVATAHGRTAAGKPAGAAVRIWRFCREYNDERPHQALGQRTPVSVYKRSPREYPLRVPAVEYPTGYARRKGGKGGEFYWCGDKIFLSEVLAREPSGLEVIDDGLCRIWFRPVELGRFDEQKQKIS